MKDDLTKTWAGHLAENLRRLRQRRDLTQEGLARLTELPRSTIANLESGSGNPTLSVLGQLSLALQLPIPELLSAPKVRCELFPKGSLPTITRGRGGGVSIAKLLPHPLPGMEIDRIELTPGSSLSGVPHRSGTHEYLCCEKGKLTLRVAGSSFQLGSGDVAAFAGDQKHAYQNEGRSLAVGFSVVTLSPGGA
ncbi:MAG: helix-turn-helix domain-containing protein [Acidobacteriota bacterium]